MLDGAHEDDVAGGFYLMRCLHESQNCREFVATSLCHHDFHFVLNAHHLPLSSIAAPVALPMNTSCLNFPKMTSQDGELFNIYLYHAERH